MKYILLFFILASVLMGEVLNITGHLQEARLSPHMYYLDTQSAKSISPQNLSDSYDLKKITSPNLGLHFDHPIWTYVKVKNSTQKPITVILLNTLPLTESINVWIFRNDRIVQNLNSGLLEKKDDYNLWCRFSNTKITLQPYTEYQIVTRISNQKGRIDAEWLVMSEESFQHFLFRDFFVWGIILGGIFLLFILHVLLYLTIKSKSFLSYVVYIFLFWCYFFVNNGYAALLFGNGIYSSILAHISGYAIVLFYVLFLDEYLELTKRKRYQYVLKPIYVYYAFIALTSWVIIFSPMIYSFDTYYFILTGITLLILMTLTAIESTKKKTLPTFYILGQLSLFIGYIFLFLNGLQIIPTNTYNQQMLGIFTFFEMLFFALAIFVHLKYTITLKEKGERLILSQSQFSTIGQTLKNIAHQWKVPTVRLGTLITEMEAIFYQSRIFDERLDPILYKMRQSIIFMENTIIEFVNFYSDSEPKTVFKPIDEIFNIKTMLTEKMIFLNFKIECSPTLNNFYLEGSARTFAHITLILINNALDMAETRDIKSPKLSIWLEQKKQKFIIHFQDNCGGIEQKPIESIFELEVTSHPGKNRGSGLTIAKMLVEEKMGEILKVANSENGTCFSIHCTDIASR